MFDIIHEANNLFNSVTPAFSEELLYRLSITYRIHKNQMPSSQNLIMFLSYIEPQDEAYMVFTGETEQSLSVMKAVYEENYNDFLQRLEDDEEVDVSIKVTKTVNDGILSVYQFDLFLKFLKELSIIEHLKNYTELFKLSENHIHFRVLDKPVLLSTLTICFSNDDLSWNAKKSRKEMIRDCSDTGVFLQRSQYAVIPQDFMIQQSMSGCEEIATIYNKLCSILSYVYIASIANIIEDRVILQINPKNIGETFLLDELGSNVVVPQIYEWVYRDNNCVDKAGIARGIINIYCKTKADILTIGDTVYNSIISDYSIYQKNHVETYIEMKNKLSAFILETGKQIQELASSLTDGLKNNFLNVIGFALTVLFNESIDIKEWTREEVSLRVIGICSLFVIASICYLVITIIVSNKKWTWIENAYDDLKNNYKGTLDEADIQESFDGDRIKKKAYENYRSFRRTVMTIWIITILIMAGFTWFLSKPLKKSAVNLDDVPVDIEVNAVESIQYEDTVLLSDTENLFNDEEARECIEDIPISESMNDPE